MEFGFPFSQRNYRQTGFPEASNEGILIICIQSILFSFYSQVILIVLAIQAAAICVFDVVNLSLPWLHLIKACYNQTASFRNSSQSKAQQESPSVCLPHFCILLFLFSNKNIIFLFEFYICTRILLLHRLHVCIQEGTVPYLKTRNLLLAPIAACQSRRRGLGQGYLWIESRLRMILIKSSWFLIQRPQIKCIFWFLNPKHLYQFDKCQTRVSAIMVGVGVWYI